MSVGISVQVEPSSAPEPPHMEGDAISYCLANARAKAEEVASRFPGFFVLGADTEVILDGVALGKPRDRRHGYEMLRRLADQTHAVVTAFVVVKPDGGKVERTVYTAVTFKPLSDAEIEGYLNTGEPFDKAGGYGIQGVGGFLVLSISGSYSNVVGLPLAEVLKVLADVGGPTAFGG